MIKSYFKKEDFQNPVKNNNCTEFEVNNWIISEFVVKKLVPVVGFHPFPLNELMLMTSAVCRFNPALIFEWGTNIGKSARIFYEIIIAFKINCHIHSVDLPEDVFHNEHPHENRGMFVKGKKNVTLHQADGLTRSFEILSKNKPAGNVLFFVDGDHSFRTVKKEIKCILENVKNAVILLHDTFYQSEASGYNTGPYKAIKEETDIEKFNIISTGFGLPGMTLVYKKELIAFNN